ncbi:ABC transporter ATP-binding protein [Ferruginibacter sp.]|uniref:ABC transporter ATP-binding protein n=1 Tax=Ferruginibacter sp. TaxID=1940288 RepID=UPI0019B40818|nr:ABC transporter ATP-binding protein [Ferruginibacter sp.]MBC7629680.1 ABC transporter ATP-binding protein [Ferruginibacter sp.]
MQITLNNVGKRFNREWIFRHCSYQFLDNKKYAITGLNGSGKSTLLQVLSGSLSHNEGTVDFTLQQKPIENEQHFQHISIAAPYLELIEEMTAGEFLHFHKQFKLLTLPDVEILEIAGLKKAINKQIRYYSSGMKQRLKLAQAFFCDTPVLLLDEPTTNLDAEGIALYRQLIINYTANKMVIISSNDLMEYNFCDAVIAIGDYKQV